jgi:anti-anti-sigma factor
LLRPYTKNVLLDFDKQISPGWFVVVFQKEDRKIFCVAIKGSMSAALAPEDEKIIRELLDQDIALLLFDLSSMPYLGSKALRIILNATKKIGHRHGRVVLCSPNQYVREIFEISGSESLIPIADSVESGISAHWPYLNSLPDFSLPSANNEWSFEIVQSVYHKRTPMEKAKISKAGT